MSLVIGKTLAVVASKRNHSAVYESDTNHRVEENTATVQSINHSLPTNSANS